MNLNDAITELEEMIEKAEDDFEREDLLVFIGYLFGTASRLKNEHA